MTSPPGNVSDTDAILRCLRDAGEALGRSEVVARTGINPDGWPQTIRALLDTGKVTQSGTRRGAKYHAT